MNLHAKRTLTTLTILIACRGASVVADEPLGLKGRTATAWCHRDHHWVRGVQVLDIRPDGRVDSSELAIGDVIYAANGVAVHSWGDLMTARRIANERWDRGEIRYLVLSVLRDGQHRRIRVFLG